MTYRPRRASAKWLEGAPDYVLSCHDAGDRFTDRYTVFFGGELWSPEMSRRVAYLGLSEHPTHPAGGVSQWGEARADERDASGPKIRWLDLPEHIREHVIARATGPEPSRRSPEADEGPAP